MALHLKMCACLVGLSATVLLGGCTHLTGLIDAHDQFGCGLPDGVSCSNLTQTYERESRRMDAQTGETVTPTSDVHVPTAHSAQLHAPAGGDAPRMIEPRVAALARDRRPALKADPVQLRSRAPESLVMLWILPWVDSDGDLHGQNRVWVRVRDARWNVDRVRTRAMQAGRIAIEP